MTWTIRITRPAERDLDALPIEVRERVVRKLQAASRDPFRFFERMTDRPDWKLRVGDYRVLAELSLRTTTMWVTAAGHRRNIYDG